MMTTYLLTGGAGFIGSHLSERLIADGHRVLVIDDLSTGSVSNIEHLLNNERFQFARAAVNEKIVLDRMASEADIIIHLAAAVGVQLVVDRPVHTIETNVMGTEAVLRAGLRYGTRVLVASTSEVYGKSSKIPFTEEDDLLLGATSKSRWGYAASKMVDEFLSLAYKREFGLDTVVFRLFNTVGPRQSSRYGMVIPRFVRQALRNEIITVYGDGNQSRCFCDVRDVIRAISNLSVANISEERVFNIGGSHEISILDLAKLVKSMTKSESEIKLIPYSEAYAPGFEDMMRRVPNVQRINDTIGWSQTFDLETTIGDVITYEQREL